MDDSTVASENSLTLPAKPVAGPKRYRDAMEAPVRKLTVNLLATYKEINAVYYRKKRERQAQKDAEASGKAVYDYQVKIGDMLGTKYRVAESLGKGSFGQVVSAVDITTGQRVAVKVIKNKEAFRRQARTEIRLLQTLNEKDPSDQWCIVRFQEQFAHNGHTCLVFEHLSFNLYELLKRTHFNGVSLNLVRKFARQILKTLAYLSLPDVDVIHCDLKPENILFRQPNRSAIKVIDFGSSCKAKEQMYVYIQSRFYRSPEIILGLPYSQAIDMWSLGCILVEMHTGTPLFSGRNEHDQMRRFVALKGLPPQSMLEAGKKTSQFFTVEVPKPPTSSRSPRARDDKDADADSDGSDSDLEGDEEKLLAKNFEDVEFSDTAGTSTSASQSRKSKRRRRRSVSPPPANIYRLKPQPKSTQREVAVHTNLRDVIGVHTGGPSGRRKLDKIGHSEHAYIQFLDLVERMLDYDPATRIKPMQALNHPFLREEEVPTSPVASSAMSSTLPVAASSSAATGTAGGAGAASTATATATATAGASETLTTGSSHAAGAPTAGAAADSPRKRMSANKLGGQAAPREEAPAAGSSGATSSSAFNNNAGGAAPSGLPRAATSATSVPAARLPVEVVAGIQSGKLLADGETIAQPVLYGPNGVPYYLTTVPPTVRHEGVGAEAGAGAGAAGDEASRRKAEVAPASYPLSAGVVASGGASSHRSSPGPAAADRVSR